MIVAVTGATGFVGTNLISELIEKGHTVRALLHSGDTAKESLRSRLAPGAQVEFHHGDVLDPGSLQRAFSGAEVVFHLAAQISISRHDAAKVLRVNVEGPRNVAAACLESGVRRMIHFSSGRWVSISGR